MCIRDSVIIQDIFDAVCTGKRLKNIMDTGCGSLGDNIIIKLFIILFALGEAYCLNTIKILLHILEKLSFINKP